MSSKYICHSEACWTGIMGNIDSQEISSTCQLMNASSLGWIVPDMLSFPKGIEMFPSFVSGNARIYLFVQHK